MKLDLMQECTTEFLLFMWSEVKDQYRTQQDKPLGGSSIIPAFDDLGYTDYSMVLKPYAQKLKSSLEIAAKSKLYCAAQQAKNISLAGTPVNAMPSTANDITPRMMYNASVDTPVYTSHFPNYASHNPNGMPVSNPLLEQTKVLYANPEQHNEHGNMGPKSSHSDVENNQFGQPSNPIMLD